ncbi:hypothetical protein M9435_001001 [Picochlorum sp. BPE23]|nr:hypothetical protein M9435_001001 [Picochlorum sp. BPE23]
MLRTTRVSSTSHVICSQRAACVSSPKMVCRSGSGRIDSRLNNRFGSSYIPRVYQNSRSVQGRRLNVILRASWNDVTFGPAKVVEQKKIANGMHRLLVDVGADASKGYTVPGQFVQIKVEESKPGFFAIASPPDVNNAGMVELLVKNAGETAEKLCVLDAGSEISVSDVMGKGFPLDRIPSNEYHTVYIFATGSGVSPIKAIIESDALKAKERKLVKLYYGAKNREAMAYGDSLEEWKKLYGVEVEPVFSETGVYVQDAFAKENPALGPGVAAIVCGQKEMAEAVRGMFAEAGIDADLILTNF